MSDAASYKRVFDKAERSRDKMFTVLFRTNASDDARLGLAIAKKHCRLATNRNRLKRVVRESFRKHLPQLAGLDIIVLNRPPATRAGNEALFNCLENHWRKCADASSANLSFEAGKD